MRITKKTVAPGLVKTDTDERQVTPTLPGNMCILVHTWAQKGSYTYTGGGHQNSKKSQVGGITTKNLSESDATPHKKLVHKDRHKDRMENGAYNSANGQTKFVDLPIRLKRQTNIWYPNHTSPLYASAQEGAFMKEKRTVALTLHIDSGDSPWNWMGNDYFPHKHVDTVHRGCFQIWMRIVQHTT